MNLYKDFVPKDQKGNDWIDADKAMSSAMIGILYRFIEEECQNGPDMPYMPKPDKSQPDSEESYRGLSAAHLAIDENVRTVIDLYFWFRDEMPAMDEEANADIEALFHYPRKKRPLLKGPDPNRKKYWVSRHLDDFSFRMMNGYHPEKIDKLVQLVKISPAMWT